MPLSTYPNFDNENASIRGINLKIAQEHAFVMHIYEAIKGRRS